MIIRENYLKKIRGFYQSDLVKFFKVLDVAEKVLF